MARGKNELSPVQRNPALFAKIQDEIRYFKPDYLATLGNISRTTIFKFNRGEPINVRHNKELHNVLKKAKELKQKADAQEVKEAEELVSE